METLNIEALKENVAITHGEKKSERQELPKVYARTAESLQQKGSYVLSTTSKNSDSMRKKRNLDCCGETHGEYELKMGCAGFAKGLPLMGCVFANCITTKRWKDSTEREVVKITRGQKTKRPG